MYWQKKKKGIYYYCYYEFLKVRRPCSLSRFLPCGIHHSLAPVPIDKFLVSLYIPILHTHLKVVVHVATLLI